MTVFQWLCAIASLTGVYLNVRKRRTCFGIFVCTNTSWCLVAAHAGLYAQATPMATYACLAVWGWWAWRPQANGTAAP